MKTILLVLGGAFTSLWAANPLGSAFGQIQWYDMTVSAPRCDKVSIIQNDIFCHLEGLPSDTTKNAYIDAAQVKATELIDAELLAIFPGDEYRTDTLSEILRSETTDPTRIQEAKGRIEELCVFAAQKGEDFSIRSETMRISYMTAEHLAQTKLINMLLDIALESISVVYTGKKVAFSSLNILANPQMRG